MSKKSLFQVKYALMWKNDPNFHFKTRLEVVFWAWKHDLRFQLKTHDLKLLFLLTQHEFAFWSDSWGHFFRKWQYSPFAAKKWPMGQHPHDNSKLDNFSCPVCLVLIQRKRQHLTQRKDTKKYLLLQPQQEIIKLKGSISNRLLNRLLTQDIKRMDKNWAPRDSYWLLKSLKASSLSSLLRAM